MNQINSYPSIYQLGHAAIKDIFEGPVTVEEKVDGSQFSFGMVDGELVARSKGKQLIIDAPEKMFTKAVATIKEVAAELTPDWIYRGEYLQSPKHNTLAYDRVPAKNIVIFDVMTGPEVYLSHPAKYEEARRLGFETVPLLFSGKVENYEMFQSFLERVSFLGGNKVEGVVIKNYQLFTQEKKIALAKYVSEAFKEVHVGEWKKNNPNSHDVETLMIEKYRTPARWNKAIEHLRDNGVLEGSPRDIPALMKEVSTDTEKECADEIKEALYKHFWPKIQRGIIRGLPEHYKEQLAQSAFETE